MGRKCSHRYKDGTTAITDGVCDICKEEFNSQFIKKQRDKEKRKKHRSMKVVTDL